MTLAHDKIELAQQISEGLKEGIKAGPNVFYRSIYLTKSDYCKNLIKPLLEEYNIEILLESLPPHRAKSLKEKYSMLMSRFDSTGELLNQKLRIETVNRYANDLIEELLDIAQEGKHNTKATKEKTVRPGPRIKHTDEKLQLALISFEKFNAEYNDAKQAWNKVAEHHGFKSGIAARQACYRFRQKRNK